VFAASKYEKELEEHLGKLHTEEQTVVTKWVHTQSSRNGLALRPERTKNEGCQAVLEARRTASTAMLQRATTANIQVHRNAKK